MLVVRAEVFGVIAKGADELLMLGLVESGTQLDLDAHAGAPPYRLDLAAVGGGAEEQTAARLAELLDQHIRQAGSHQVNRRASQRASRTQIVRHRRTKAQPRILLRRSCPKRAPN